MALPKDRIEYTQEARAANVPCPNCGKWHTSAGCPIEYYQAMDAFKEELTTPELTVTLFSTPEQTLLLRDILKELREIKEILKGF